MRMAGFFCVCSLAVLVAGCSKAGPPRKETFKVAGKVTVDGQPPGGPIQVGCHNVAGMDAAMPTVSQTETKDDGSFEISTYQAGDGVPAGEYKLTFVWQDFQLISRSYSGPDKLNKRYSDPQKTEIAVTVKDQSVDLGEVKLTTK